MASFIPSISPSHTVRTSITKGGIKATWQEIRRNYRRVERFGCGRVIGWNRDSMTAYSHLRTGKGRLKAWREKIGKTEFGYCERRER